MFMNLISIATASVNDKGLVLLHSFLPLDSFAKVVKLLSHIVTMFLNQLDVESGNQMEKHRKFWEKIILQKKRSWFCISVMHKNKDYCFTEYFLGSELYKRCWIKIWVPKKQDQCSPVIPFWVSFFCILKHKSQIGLKCKTEKQPECILNDHMGSPEHQ